MFKDYTMNQLVLPIDLEVSLQENDIAFHIHYLVESIPKEAFRPFFKNNGCPAYDVTCATTKVKLSNNQQVSCKKC